MKAQGVVACPVRTSHPTEETRLRSRKTAPALGAHEKSPLPEGNGLFRAHDARGALLQELVDRLANCLGVGRVLNLLAIDEHRGSALDAHVGS